MGGNLIQGNLEQYEINSARNWEMYEWLILAELKDVKIFWQKYKFLFYTPNKIMCLNFI